MKSYIGVIGLENLVEMVSEVCRVAAHKALASGWPVVFSENGKLFQRFPDGRVEPLKTQR